MSDRVERRIWLPADPDDVWEVVTGGDWLAEEVSLDLRPGGDASFRSGDELKTGWVEEAARPSEDGDGRLAFWWGIDGEPATRVEVTVQHARGWDGPDGTRLRIVETRPLDALDLVATPLPGVGGSTYGPALLAA
ncbi:MAG TPA: hypothetical protein VGX45_16215 [Solirubrobacteraceae bacterium]|jgi:hypothetical protein|nr:hypothetical protein [Solirubrobacteraceae bacterium]